jgi:hypothetical protein
VIVEDKRLMYKLSRQIVDTTGSAKGTKWIFVLSTCKTLYIGQVNDDSLKEFFRTLRAIQLLK